MRQWKFPHPVNCMVHCRLQKPSTLEYISKRNICSGSIKRESGPGAFAPFAGYVLIVRGIFPLRLVYPDRASVLFSIFLRPVPPNAPISVVRTQLASPGLIPSQFHQKPLPSQLQPQRTPVY